MRAAVVAGMDTSPVFQPPEHVLDFVTLTVERVIVRDMQLPVRL